MLRRQRRHTTTWLIGAAWLLLTSANVAALAGLVGWLPSQFVTVMVGVLLALTIVAVSWQSQASVRAAFIDGMIYQRQNAAADPLPRAVGDGVAGVQGATVIRMGGRRRPSPRHGR